MITMEQVAGWGGLRKNKKPDKPRFFVELDDAGNYYLYVSVAGGVPIASFFGGYDNLARELAVLLEEKQNDSRKS